MIVFFQPYLQFCYSATYSLIQNMESMGWISFWHGAYIDPHSTFTSFFGLYVILFISVVLLHILASFSLHRNLGVIITLLWLMPGAFSLFGVNIVPIDVPDAYILNSGSMYVGETKSTLYNVFVIFLLGWSFTTLFVHLFKIKAKFKDAYDHIWYVIGLAAAVIFVVDSNTSYYKSELLESEDSINSAITIIIKQLNYTHSICLKEPNELSEQGISDEFCSWVEQSKNKYFRMSESSSFTREFESTKDFKSLIPQKQVSDILKFNNYICNSPTEHYNCTKLSFKLGRFWADFDWPNDKFSLAIVPLNNALEAFWQQSVKRNKKLDSVKNVPNSKWFFYMVLGLIAGGKVANSSRSLIGEPKPVFRYWCFFIFYIIKWLIGTVWGVFKKCLNLLKRLMNIGMDSYKTFIILLINLKSYFINRFSR